jgi:hypothetical protein
LAREWTRKYAMWFRSSSITFPQSKQTHTHTLRTSVYCL